MSAIMPLRRFFAILFIIGAIIVLILCYALDYLNFNRMTPTKWLPTSASGTKTGKPVEISLHKLQEDAGIGKVEIKNNVYFLTDKGMGKSASAHNSNVDVRRLKTGRTFFDSHFDKEPTQKVRTSSPTTTLPLTTAAPLKYSSSLSKIGEKLTLISHKPVLPKRIMTSTKSPLDEKRKMWEMREMLKNRYRHNALAEKVRTEKLSKSNMRSGDSNDIINHLVITARPKPRIVNRIVPTATTTQRPLVTAKPKPTARPRTCDQCMNHDFRLLIQPPPCDVTTPPELLLAVISSPGKIDMRNAIRNSWGQSRNGKVKLVFLFGRPKDRAFQQTLHDEDSKFHDILQEDFVDSYGNLTFKTMMALKFVNNHCPRAKYVMKTDDDMWINVPGFFNAVKRYDMSSSIGGMCLLNAGPIRDTRSKWYASPLNYPENKYPGFCSGTAYFMTAQTAVRIFEVSPNVPFFYLEDVYVSLCAERAGVELKPVDGFHNYRVSPGNWCGYKKSWMVSSHGVSADELKMLEKLRC